MSRAWKPAGFALAVALCSWVIAASAQAKGDPVTGGHATVTASSALSNFIAFLRSQGVTVTTIGPAKLTDNSLTLPVVGGKMTVPEMSGEMSTAGGLRFQDGARVLKVRDYTISHHGHKTTLTALVSSTRLSPRRIVVSHMDEVDTAMSGRTGTMTGGLEITGTWADLINRLTDKHLLKAGEDLGDMSATVHIA